MSKNVLKISISLLIIGLVAGFIGFTYSYFQDTEVSENNVFSAGTLDLKTNDKDGVEATWQTDNMLPGDTVEGEIEFKNAGSIPIESLLMEVKIEQE